MQQEKPFQQSQQSYESQKELTPFRTILLLLTLSEAGKHILTTGYSSFQKGHS